MMAVVPMVRGGIMGRIYDTGEFSVSNLALQRLEITAQFLPECFQVCEELRPIRLEFVSNLLSHFWRGRVVQLDQQQPLLPEILISGLVEIQDQCFDVVRHAL